MSRCPKLRGRRRINHRRKVAILARQWESVLNKSRRVQPEERDEAFREFRAWRRHTQGASGGAS